MLKAKSPTQPPDKISLAIECTNQTKRVEAEEEGRKDDDLDGRQDLKRATEEQHQRTQY